MTLSSQTLLMSPFYPPLWNSISWRIPLQMLLLPYYGRPTRRRWVVVWPNLVQGKKEFGQLLNDILQQVADLDRKHKIALHKMHLETLTRKRKELKALLDLQTIRKFHLISQKIYEWGISQADISLAPYAHKKSASFISKIKLPSGDLAHISNFQCLLGILYQPLQC